LKKQQSMRFRSGHVGIEAGISGGGGIALRWVFGWAGEESKKKMGRTEEARPEPKHCDLFYLVVLAFDGSRRPC
jgi:hypothetical protein